METKVPVGLSNKHLHLSQKDADILFGEGYKFTPKKPLKQPGQFACEEMVEVKGIKGSINMRVLGPIRKESQVEILMGDSFKLGVKPVVAQSGKLEGTPGITLVGPKGSVEIEKGVIVAARHLHLSAQQALDYDLNDGDIVSIKAGGERGVIFNNVLVRAGDKHEREFHVDTEEGNAAGLKNGDELEIVDVIRK